MFSRYISCTSWKGWVGGALFTCLDNGNAVCPSYWHHSPNSVFMATICYSGFSITVAYEATIYKIYCSCTQAFIDLYLQETHSHTWRSQNHTLVGLHLRTDTKTYVHSEFYLPSFHSLTIVTITMDLLHTPKYFYFTHDKDTGWIFNGHINISSTNRLWWTRDTCPLTWWLVPIVLTTACKGDR